jgi:hypothetical protein
MKRNQYRKPEPKNGRKSNGRRSHSKPAVLHPFDFAADIMNIDADSKAWAPPGQRPMKQAFFLLALAFW